MNWKGKTVLITGGSSGIGAELARAINVKGGRIVLASRNQDKLIEVQRSLSGWSKVFELDLGSEKSISDFLKNLENQGIHIDVLINNGGISQRSLSLETQLEVDRKIMEVNYFGSVALTKALVPKMLERGFGKIVSISSIAGCFGFPLRSAYSASKHAMVGFYESLSLELDQEAVDVHLVFPGRVQTSISSSALTGKGEAHGQADPGQEEGIPAEKCAQDVLRGIEKGKFKTYSGGKELLMVKIHRWFPRIFRKLATKISPT